MSVRVIRRFDERRLDQLWSLYAHAWWTRNRTREGVRRVVEGSAVALGLVDTETDGLPGFVRALSDGVYKAVIFDVIVDPRHRGTGLGARLMDEVMAHPKVAGVEHVELHCLRHMFDFYRRWGFTEDPSALHLMQSAG